MNKFAVVYQSEVKKMFKGKSLFVLSIITVLLIGLITLCFEIIIPNAFLIGNPTYNITTPEQGIAVYEEQIKTIEDSINSGAFKPKFNDSTLSASKRMLTYYKFLQANNLSVSEVTPYSPQTDIQSMATGMGYVNAVMQSVLLLATVAIVLSASSNIIGELKSGSLKMQLLRPVSRQTMLSAKASATMTGGLFIYGGTTIISIIYAMIRFNKAMLPQVTFFNDSTAILIPAGGIFVIQFFAGILSMLFYCSLTYAVGFLSNSKSSAMGVPLGIMIAGGLASTILGYIYIGYIDPLYNLDFMHAVSASNNIYGGSNIIISLVIIFAYIALFTSYSYITFKKRDIN